MDKILSSLLAFAVGIAVAAEPSVLEIGQKPATSNAGFGLGAVFDELSPETPETPAPAPAPEKPVKPAPAPEKPVTSAPVTSAPAKPVASKPVTNTVEKIVERVVERDRPIEIRRPATNTVRKVSRPTATNVVEKVVQPTATNVVEKVAPPTVTNVAEKVAPPTATNVAEKVVQPVATNTVEAAAQPEAKEPKAKEPKKLTGRPARITSDTTIYNRKEGIASFEGHVHVDDEQYQMHADRVYLFMEGTNELKRVVALGHVALTNEARRAYGTRATYSRKNGLVVLYSGDGITAEVRDESKAQEQVVRGKRIRFWIGSEQVEVDEADLTGASPSGGADSIKKILDK